MAVFDGGEPSFKRGNRQSSWPISMAKNGVVCQISDTTTITTITGCWAANKGTCAVCPITPITLTDQIIPRDGGGFTATATNLPSSKSRAFERLYWKTLKKRRYYNFLLSFHSSYCASSITFGCTIRTYEGPLFSLTSQPFKCGGSIYLYQSIKERETCIISSRAPDNKRSPRGEVARNRMTPEWQMFKEDWKEIIIFRPLSISQQKLV